MENILCLTLMENCDVLSLKLKNEDVLIKLNSFTKLVKGVRLL
jgi:hypothetical protein